MKDEPRFLEVAVTRRDHPDVIRWGPFCSLSSCEEVIIQLAGVPDVLQAIIVSMETKQPPSADDLRAMLRKPQEKGNGLR
jgi:hypothetical protein